MVKNLETDTLRLARGFFRNFQNSLTRLGLSAYQMEGLVVQTALKYLLVTCIVAPVLHIDLEFDFWLVCSSMLQTWYKTVES